MDSERLTDRISIGVLARIVPRDLVDEARRAVTDTDLPLLDRVAATLILLYSYALSGGP
ncbi:hypothetical protein CEDDRAFT_02522 [Frankia sp. CeD]|nr:hypothetical protein CEDDRAFT_02522 [Frankia sp. CeD]